jgi:hypothetical protein
MDEELVEANTVNNNIVTMFTFLGVVALLLIGHRIIYVGVP